jgi:carotenoid cleavage dioxygenase-like enzyme
MGNVTNAAQQPFLEGILFPVDDELDVADLAVTGEIPEGLRGDFVRNGPNPMFEPLGRYHMFDGDGMLHRVSFGAGKASYRNRWIRSAGLEVEMAAGRAIYGGLAEMKFPDPAEVGDAGPMKNVANTHIIKHAGRYLALWEGGLPTEVTRDLETVGPWNFGADFRGPMTAHPHTDPRTGEMFFFGYNPFPPYLQFHQVSAAGELVRSVDIDLPAPVIMHDFCFTTDHVIFVDSPFSYDLEAAMRGEPMSEWRADNGTRIGVMARDSDDIRWFEIENGWVNHFWNAWTEGNTITFSGARLDEISYGFEEGGSVEEIDANSAAGRPARFQVDLDAGVAKWEQLDDMGGDFTRINDAYFGVPSRYHYMAGFGRTEDRVGMFDTIVKYDDQTGAKTTWDAGEHAVPAKPCSLQTQMAQPKTTAGSLPAYMTRPVMAPTSLCSMPATFPAGQWHEYICPVGSRSASTPTGSPTRAKSPQSQILAELCSSGIVLPELPVAAATFGRSCRRLDVEAHALGHTGPGHDQTVFCSAVGLGYLIAGVLILGGGGVVDGLGRWGSLAFRRRRGLFLFGQIRQEEVRYVQGCLVDNT